MNPFLTEHSLYCDSYKLHTDSNIIILNWTNANPFNMASTINFEKDIASKENYSSWMRSKKDQVHKSSYHSSHY